VLSIPPPLIAIGLSFYEDANSLVRCLASLLELKDYIKIIAIDGKYKGYPAKNDLSEDGSREVIQEFKEQQYPPNAIELFDFPNLHERFKRQKYVDIAAKQQIPFLLILDSDEHIECKSVPDFLDELKMIQDVWVDREKVLAAEKYKMMKIIPRVSNVYQIKCVDLDHLGYVINAASRPRLWYRPQDMMYTKHSFFRVTRDENDKHEKLFDPSQQFAPLFVLQNMQIWHSHSYRTEDREERRQFYEQEQLPKLEQQEQEQE